MDNQPYLSVIIPAHNEAKRLPLTLIDIDKRLAEVRHTYEIVVVNDCSTDDTAAVVQRFAGLVKHLRLIDNKEHKGKGGVVRDGMLKTHGAYRLFTDADNSTSVDQFLKMIPYLEEGYDVVIGSRAVKGAKLEPAEPFYRQLFGKGLNIIVQLLLLPGIWDTQCGFKVFSAEAAEKIFSQSRISGWGFDVEVLSLAKRMGYRIKEMPVRWVDDTRSQVKFSAGFQFLRDIGKIRLWLWRGTYDFSRAAPGGRVPDNGKHVR
jgi:dolichyl-phosphate beta-glucosyltransferase